MTERTCPIDCRTADTDNCECSCGGKHHGTQKTIDSFKQSDTDDKEPEDIDPDELVLECRVCGVEANYTDPFMCAVDRGTPLADELNLTEDQLHTNKQISGSFYPVCDNCYERGCDGF